MGEFEGAYSTRTITQMFETQVYIPKGFDLGGHSITRH